MKALFNYTVEKLWLFAFMIFALFSVMALAQVGVDPSVPPATNEDFLALLIQSIGGVKSLGSLAVVALAVQVVMKFLGTPWADKLFEKSGAVKLLLIALFTLVGGVTTLMMSGLTLGAALVHSTSLTAIMVLFHQIYKQWIEKK